MMTNGRRTILACAVWLIPGFGCAGDDGSGDGTGGASSTGAPDDGDGGDDTPPTDDGPSEASADDTTSMGSSDAGPDDGTDDDSTDDGMDDTSGSTGPDGPPADCVAMVDAANAFLQALDADQADTATFDFSDEERQRFEFLPPNSAARAGLTMRDMDDAQRDLLGDFLSSALSGTGYTKEEDIRQLESVLAMQESGQPVTDNRDPDNYFISFFGTPNVEDGTPWSWRFEGHHMSLHGSALDCEQFAATPAFWGASPNLDPLQPEIDLEQALWDALDGDQQGMATDSVGADAVEQKQGTIDALATQGLPGGMMTAAQVTILQDLVASYADNATDSVAQARLAAVEADGFDDVYYVRDGGNGNFRVLGPAFLIEFVYAGGTHVHAVWREYAGDYGEDLIAAHLRHHKH